MPTIHPIARALVPVDSAAAAAIGAPNYDEFQSDEEVWHLLQAQPESVLRSTMPHCHVTSIEAIGEDGSEESLAHARTEMLRLIAGPLTRCGCTRSLVPRARPRRRSGSVAWR